MSVLLEPANLEADAVVPQCLDNQHVSDAVYKFMMDHGVGYDHPRVSQLREADVKTEFVRSLVYSSQVVIQRAFLKNNDFLYKNYLPEDRKNVSAFAQLIRDRAIVPYLFRESTLTDNLEFDSRAEGDRALETLLAEVGENLACVRLSANDATNNDLTKAMSKSFTSLLSELGRMDDADCRSIATELFSSPQDLRAVLADDDAFKRFKQSLWDLADYADDTSKRLTRSNNKSLSRSKVYNDNFIAEGGRIELGNFQPRTADNPFVFELKKYVDLVYNTNLPDALERYTFTPLGLPSRMALQDPTSKRKNVKHEQIQAEMSNPEALESIRRTFMARVQKGMFLPQLSDMSMADVAAVRALPEWETFKAAQSGILNDPINYLSRLEEFQTGLDDFQQSLSQWYQAQYPDKVTTERFCNYASYGISITGRTVVAGSNAMPISGALTPLDDVEKIRKSLPKRVKGYAVKLIANVFDREKQRIDKTRSYSIELMQTNDELDQDDVIEIFRGIAQKPGEGIPAMVGQLADQGID
ncbi:MAG: hypothetical protein AAFR12_13030 [Cyanobacteria bacterium J06626_6]